MPRRRHVEVFDGLGVQYTLGGFGEEGALKDSKPSKERHRLLRREALELALYSFRYLPDVTMVVALLPPAPQGASRSCPTAKPDAEEEGEGRAVQHQALFYRPGDLKDRSSRRRCATRWRRAAADDRRPRAATRRRGSTR